MGEADGYDIIGDIDGRGDRGHRRRRGRPADHQARQARQPGAGRRDVHVHDPRRQQRPVDGVDLVVTDTMVSDGLYTITQITDDRGGTCLPTPPLTPDRTEQRRDVPCTLDELPAHERWTIVAIGTADETMDVNNVASVYAETPPDPDYSNNYARGAISVLDTADLGITKEVVPGYDIVVAGETAGWRISVTNYGPSTAENVVVTDPLPEGLVDGSVFGDVIDMNCTLGTPGDPADPMVCNLGTIAVGDTVTFDVFARRGPSVLREPAADRECVLHRQRRVCRQRHLRSRQQQQPRQRRPDDPRAGEPGALQERAAAAAVDRG